VYYVLTVSISIWTELDDAERRRYVAMLVLLLAPAITLAVMLERLQPGLEAGWAATSAKAVAVVLVWGATVFAAWRHGRWSEAIRRDRRGSLREPNAMIAERSATIPPANISRPKAKAEP
jgi:membrane protein YdbS with pleckstrin-like domain